MGSNGNTMWDGSSQGPEMPGAPWRLNATPLKAPGTGGDISNQVGDVNRQLGTQGILQSRDRILGGDGGGDISTLVGRVGAMQQPQYGPSTGGRK